MRINKKTIIISIVVILVIVSFSIASVNGFFGWFEPRMLIVDDDGKADFEVIQFAIDAAMDGDIVFMKNGN